MLYQFFGDYFNSIDFIYYILKIATIFINNNFIRSY